MLITWWLHLMDGIGHYIIHLGSVAQILVTNNNVTTLGYTYAKCRLNNPPQNFCEIAHIDRLIAWIPSRISWISELQGKEQYLLRTSLPKEFSVTNNQEGLTAFDVPTQYTVWDSVCTNSVNLYFEL